MEQVSTSGRRPVLFIAERQFVYLGREKVWALVLALQDRFPGAELVYEVVNKRRVQWTVHYRLEG